MGICLNEGEKLTARSPLWIWVTISFCYTNAHTLTPCLNLKNKSHPGEGVSKGNARLGVSVHKKSPVGKPLRLQSAKAEKNLRGILKGPAPQSRSLKSVSFPGFLVRRQEIPKKIYIRFSKTSS